MTDPVHPEDYDQKPKVSLHSAALYYVSIGLKVFALQPGSKVPLKGSNGCRGATSDVDMINRWWEGNPHANIGIATGHLVDVIDIDGELGVQSLVRPDADGKRLIDHLPKVYGVVSTPRPGGSHYFIAATPGRGNKAALFPGVDIRAAGGFVVGVPSVITEGKNPGTYYWRTPLNLEGLA